MEIIVEKRWLAPLIVGCIALILLLLENVFPLRKRTQKFSARIIPNIAMASLTFIVASLLVRPSSFATLNWATESKFGLLNFLELPIWAESVIGFLLLDLSFYYWHVVNHRVPFFWRFHLVHHIDPDLDTTTGFRFHFIEVAFSAVFRVIQVALIGPSLALFLTYELIFQIATFFHHSNLNLPARLDRFLNYLIVTPRMHGIHHSQVVDETNSNYSVVFSLWDRMHRSFNSMKPDRSDLVIGVKEYSPIDNKSYKLIKLPFSKGVSKGA